MSEEMLPNNEANRGFFEKGMLVKFRKGLSAEVREGLEESYNLNSTYRIFEINHHDDEGGDSAWIGPPNASDKDIENFDSEQYVQDHYDDPSQEREITPVATSLLSVFISELN